ncbi:MAG: AAA family ATPase, partial [Candidatus Dormibacteraceae bacterium]
MKSSTIFLCRECGGESIRWLGQCPHCQQWNTLEEFNRPARAKARETQSLTPPSPLLPISEVEVESAPRTRLAWEELNRVLGGGLVPGSLILLGGEPGVGKSTLLLHLALQAASPGRPVLYVSGEESAHQVALRAQRLKALEPNILLLAETDLERVLSAAQECSPSVVIIDSIQTVFDPGVEALAGSVSQVRACADRLLRLAKQSGTPIFLVGHITKEGSIAGPRVLEHMVDTVLWLEGERSLEFRILRATKNRFGSAQEIGIFAMGEGGLEEVADPTALLLGELSEAAGTVVLPALEGTRPLLVEVQ